MTDQAASLRKRGVAAAILSNLDVSDKFFLATSKGLETLGMFSLLFASPEAVIGDTKWRENLMTYPLSERIVALAVDEAHCISKWYILILCMFTNHIVQAVIPVDTVVQKLHTSHAA